MSQTMQTTEPVFDQQALDRHTMGNASLQRELFILFFDQMPVYLDQMDDAISSNDTESWRMAAHGIKGSSRALGFTRLAALSRDCENSSPDRDQMKALRDAIKESEACISMAEAS